MEHAYFLLLHYLTGHPGWALAVVFIAAILESVAIIGTFVPGSTAMFVAGALVGTGALNLGWVMACAVAGAVAGDAASYWFGARYKTTITGMWPFRTHPGLLASGEKYFEQHGAKSVIFARFIAPLRAIVPVVAGMLGMSPARFLAVNIVSALLWAPAHILPGVVFGASIELAGAVSFRLVVVVAILVAAGWLTFRLVSVMVAHARAWTDASRQRLLNWARNSSHASGRIVLRLLTPDNPPAGLIAAISLLLLISGAVFFYALNDIARGNLLVQMDTSVYRFLQAFHSSWSDDAVALFSALGSVPTLVILVLLVVLWMTLERRWRTLAYWLVAVAFSQVLVLAIQIATQGFRSISVASGVHAFPSNHMAANVVIYGFLAVLLVRRTGMPSSVLIATTTIAIVFATAVAGLYAGRFSFSGAVGGAALAAIWVFLIALTTVWRSPSKPRARPFMPVVIFAVICASAAIQLETGAPAEAAVSERPPPVIVVTPAQWTDTIWRRFSCYRSSMEGDRPEPITVQWSATAEQICTQLKSRDWIEGTQL